MLWQAALLMTFLIALPIAGQRPVPTTQRQSASDLEFARFDSAGVRQPSLFLSRKYLSRLPQVSAPLQPDENFPELPLDGARFSGIDLGLLLSVLAPSDPSIAVLLTCRDGYTSPFPRQAILDHRPILILTIDGLTPHQWARRHHVYDPSPYVVTYVNFAPAFHFLAHQDFPQHPAEIVRLEIVSSDRLFAAITPPNADRLPADSAILTGFHIAQQNCFRCHNSGDTGGTKAQRTWLHLAGIAKLHPEYFARWVHNPQSIDPHAEMTPNLQYDQATLNALTRYFQTFAP